MAGMKSDEMQSFSHLLVAAHLSWSSSAGGQSDGWAQLVGTTTPELEAELALLAEELVFVELSGAPPVELAEL